MSSQRRTVCHEKSDDFGLFHDDPIVIVGFGMRLPGGVNSASSFWEMLVNKNDSHGDVPASRFNASSFVDPSKGPTTGYFLQEDPAYFDASFFSIPAVEAMEMDPQQRLLMEIVWECLENAGETRWQGKSIRSRRSSQMDTQRDNHESRIHEPEFTQPLCTALQVALVDMLATWHIWPGSVIGHSSGEIAAAYAAGAITSRSAIIIAYYRGKLASSLHGNGAMIAVGLGRQDITPYLKEGLVLACENSPASVTLSGDIEAINQAVDTIRAASPDIFCKKLRHNVAYHSHHMDAVGSSYESAIAPYICHSSHPMLPMVSSVTCGRISDPHKLDASYWRRNLESPVQFSQAVHNLLQDDALKTNNRVFIEVGPHAALGAPLRQIFQHLHGTAESPVYMPTLIQNDDNPRAQLLGTAGHAFVAGVPVNFAAVVDGQTPLNNLPVYPWKHDIRYWSESRLSSEWRLRALPHHELLGSRIVEATDLHPSWRNVLQVEKVPWLEQHILQEQITFPGAGYIAMAGEAVQQIHPEARLTGYSIRNIHFKAPLLIDPVVPTEIITTLYPIEYADDAPSGWYSFIVSAYNDTSWIKYCQGQVRSGRDDHHLIMAMHIRSYVRSVSCERWYKTARRLGLEYGRRFCGLRDISTDPIGSAAATGTATDPSEVHDSRYTQHPVIIDQCLQLMGIAASRGIMHRLTKLYIPVMIESLYVGSGAPEVVVDALTMEGIRDGLSGNAIGMVDGKPALVIEKALL
ncbi:Mycolipanoate synthase [Aspergillus melleus]|uniref:Mycolipanoate synthase n=1 Tax=Aspergillus melleus TaxID=138277 RepID=UPI001E8EEDDD|nr:Mycolipanoate synthase [Aspergillus melleus]KAH8427264.1 Mycolipanoate synthase [Aspergillus melleus]